MSATRIGPKALLSLCHEVDELSEKLREFSAFGLQHLDVRRKRVIRQIRGALHGQKKDRFQTRLRTLRSEHSLSETEVLVLLLLFNRRVRKAQPTCSGRDLIETVSKDGGDLLEAAPMLHPDGALLTSGLVTTDAAGAEDALDGGFRITDRAYRMLYRAYQDLPESAANMGEPGGYANAAEHIVDLCVLCDLTKQRAARLFPLSAWTDCVVNDGRDIEEIATRIAQIREFIRARELATPESVRLPIVEVRHAFALTDAEEMILLTLLQHELFAARTSFELAELARLAATSETDVVACRAILGTDATLRRTGLLAVEEEPAGKDLFGGAWLPHSVSEKLLGNLDKKGAIDAEETSTFRRYLEGLADSDDFYRRL